jgi:hypothetical protein
MLKRLNRKLQKAEGFCMRKEQIQLIREVWKSSAREGCMNLGISEIWLERIQKSGTREAQKLISGCAYPRFKS